MGFEASGVGLRGVDAVEDFGLGWRIGGGFRD